MWQTIRTSALGHHSHREGYAAVVLSGGYEEAGDHGRFQVKAGQVVFHDRFEAHLNRVAETGAVVLNLGFVDGHSCTPGVATVNDLDFVVRVAERCRRDASEMISTLVTRCEPQTADWPDALAATLRQNPSLKLARWAEENGLSPWAVSRGFAQVFGISPKTFRARIRAHRALKRIQQTQEPLASIAVELGFADQAHMTRSVRQLSGMGPQGWRFAANRFKTRIDRDL